MFKKWLDRLMPEKLAETMRSETGETLIVIAHDRKEQPIPLKILYGVGGTFIHYVPAASKPHEPTFFDMAKGTSSSLVAKSPAPHAAAPSSPTPSEQLSASILGLTPASKPTTHNPRTVAIAGSLIEVTISGRLYKAEVCSQGCCAETLDGLAIKIPLDGWTYADKSAPDAYCITDAEGSCISLHPKCMHALHHSTETP